MSLLQRDIEKHLNPWLKRDEIVVILGARQVGKTSLLLKLKEDREREGKPTFYLDLEDLDLRASIKTAGAMLSYLQASGLRKKEKTFLFLDEIHHLEHAGSILKTLHDHHPELKIIATGSSSLRLRLKMEEALTGRKVVLPLYPLSFGEYLTFTGRAELHDAVERVAGEPLPEPFLRRIAVAHEEYLTYGGYPKVALEPSVGLKELLLKEIQSTYIEKELRGLLREENFLKFKAFMEFLAAQHGGLLKISEISKEIGIARETASRYAAILEETFILGLVRPMALNRQKEITHLPKAYFLDTGFLNFTLKDFRPLSLRRDCGGLLEGSVFTMLLRNLRGTDELRFFRTKTKEEIDFILKRGTKIIPIEVKWSKEAKVPAIVHRFIKMTEAKTCYIITRGGYGSARSGGTELSILPPWAFERILSRRSDVG